MAHTEDLLSFIDASPSPFHAVAEAAARLDAAGFQRVEAAEAWPAAPGGRYVATGGALSAWVQPEPGPVRPFRVVGAHTDSPNLRCKPHPDVTGTGWRQVGVEVYGGALWNSWLDRDLGLSGRLVVRSSARPTVVLVRIDEPFARIPQLAIHLDRQVNSEGLRLNPQQHLRPVWGLAEPTRPDTAPAGADGGLLAEVARRADQDPADVLGAELMFHDLTPSTMLGADESLVSAPRIDNLLSCWAGLEALLASEGVARGSAANADAPIPVLALFDHEEVGSTSATGADSTWLGSVLERIVTGLGGDRETLLRALAESWCLSADGAHATHPNWPERHDAEHRIAIDGGPVLKHNANVRYATDAEGTAVVHLAAEAADVPLQEFVMRTDMACGSTIGPSTAARVGLRTVDVGVAQLAMHSARELCGRRDPERFVDLLGAFLAPPG